MHIAFDLDGTLIDSVPDLHRVASELLQRHERPPLPLPTVRGFVGNGVPRLVERIATASDLSFSPELVVEYSRLYGASPVQMTKAFPGAEAALDALKASGAELSICTNKPEAPARTVLGHFGWTRFFGKVVGGDTLQTRKPDAAPLVAALGGADPTTAWLVGDSEVDAETAQAAGVRFALYTEGYRKTPVEQIPHDCTFSDFARLADLLNAAPG